MENFDIKNSVNPSLVEGALLEHEGLVYEVIDMNLEHILISNKEMGQKKILDSKEHWNAIELTEAWLNNFNLRIGSKIKNVVTGDDWILKKTHRYYYVTIFREDSNIEYPLIGVKTVHDLQAWFYRLTKLNLRYIV